MTTRDPRVDAYITKAPAFAQPILTHLREIAHAASPDIEEDIKWRAPAFMYGGGIVFIMATFKHHAAVNFWKSSLVLGDSADESGAAGQLGRITSVADLPSKKVLTGYVKAAMKLNEADAPAVPRPTKTAKRPTLAMPSDFDAALDANAAARTTFDAFSASQRRDYIEWITEAKTDATRTKRLAQAIEWIAEGKPRMWKYMR